MSEDEDDLLARARQGDAPAFGALVRRYQRRVYAAALHVTGNHSDADDVAQEAFVRAYRGLRTFDGRSDFFTWLYRIAINTALNRLRSSKRVQALAQASAADAAQVGGRPEGLGAPHLLPDEQARLGEEVRTVLTAVSQLSPPLRVTLILATVEALPHKQIADILEIPEGTVAWRVNEARRLLREKLGEVAPPRVKKKQGTP
ncbi:MAG TPA: sigma-70 family RNA polymerase sigma factor [Kofleriaceae bacterium]|jgi:RNA polymerase sigma-70 factor (ECF subfamily)|nr:sigma-70 family RNA polymerase sigma factor [Kofleriaceae bacterium]